MNGQVKREIFETATTQSARQVEKPRLALVQKVEIDRDRDALLTDFGKTTLEDRYLLPRRILSGYVRPRGDRVRR